MGNNRFRMMSSQMIVAFSSQMIDGAGRRTNEYGITTLRGLYLRAGFVIAPDAKTPAFLKAWVASYSESGMSTLVTFDVTAVVSSTW
jgi:hypothetical protein